jgi:hypothetical protein
MKKMDTQYKEFLNRISNTIALLGGKQDILSVLKDEEMSIDEKTYWIKKWNARQTDRLRDKIMELSGILKE